MAALSICHLELVALGGNLVKSNLVKTLCCVSVAA